MKHLINTSINTQMIHNYLIDVMNVEQKSRENISSLRVHFETEALKYTRYCSSQLALFQKQYIASISEELCNQINSFT